MRKWLGILLMWCSTAGILSAADFNLYGGKVQSITLRELTPNKEYLWELRTDHERLMKNGRVRADDEGKAEIEFDLPKLEPGTSVNCKLKILPDTPYKLVFHSRELFAPIMPELQQAGIYSDDDELKQDIEAAGIVRSEDEKTAKVVFTGDIAPKKLAELLAKGKMVIMFADGDNEIFPPREKMRKVALDVTYAAKKLPRLSVIYSKSELKIAYDGNGGIVAVEYDHGGRLIVVAAELRRELNYNPELWLILKNEITEAMKKWSKELSSVR